MTDRKVMNSARRESYAENSGTLNSTRRKRRATTADAINEYQRQYHAANSRLNTRLNLSIFRLDFFAGIVL